MRINVGSSMFILYRDGEEVGIFLWYGQAMGYVRHHLGVEREWHHEGESRRGADSWWTEKDEFEIVKVPLLPGGFREALAASKIQAAQQRQDGRPHPGMMPRRIQTATPSPELVEATENLHKSLDHYNNSGERQHLEAAAWRAQIISALKGNN